MTVKKKMRQKMVAYLNGVSKHERETTEEKLLQQFLKNPSFQQAKTIGITISTVVEWNTHPIIEKARAEGKIIASPKCIVKTREMQYYVWEEMDHIQDGYAGIKEPIPDKTTPIQVQDIDLLLVPGIIFDKEGYRIGYGGGYYDRMLMDYQGRTVSLCSEKQIVNHIPKEIHDLPVAQLITEDRVLNTGN